MGQYRKAQLHSEVNTDKVERQQNLSHHVLQPLPVQQTDNRPDSDRRWSEISATGDVASTEKKSLHRHTSFTLRKRNRSYPETRFKSARLGFVCNNFILNILHP
jgi:hypothetical protein